MVPQPLPKRRLKKSPMDWKKFATFWPKVVAFWAYSCTVPAYFRTVSMPDLNCSTLSVSSAMDRPSMLRQREMRRLMFSSLRV